MRPLRLAVSAAFISLTMTSASFAQDGVLDFDQDCLSSPIATSKTLGDCVLMIVEIAELENAAPAVVDDRIRKTTSNAQAGGGQTIMKDACSKAPLASYRGSAGNNGKVYAALCTNF